MALPLVVPAAAPGAPDAPDHAAGAPAPPPFPSTRRPAHEQQTGRPNADPIALPRVDPRVARAGTADRAVLEWLHAWHRRQLRRMATWSTARSAGMLRPGGPERLAARFRTRRLLGWIDVPLRRASTRTTYVVEIEFRTLLDPVLRRRTLIVPVIREGPLGLITGHGRWAIDAIGVHDASPLA